LGFANDFVFLVMRDAVMNKGNELKRARVPVIAAKEADTLRKRLMDELPTSWTSMSSKQLAALLKTEIATVDWNRIREMAEKAKLASLD
jgi:hypothetical protein